MKKLCTLLLILIPTLAFAEEKISEKDVINSSLKHYPAILSYYEKIEAAKGSELEAKGFFDIRLRQTYSNNSRGFYDGRISDTSIEKELGFMGAQIYGGYKKSSKDFASYDRGIKTGSDGEYRAGIKLSLLRNSGIDKNRLLLAVATLGVKEGKIQMQKIKMEIKRDATNAYWLAVTSAKIYNIYEGLYRLSLKRQKQLEEKSKQGAVAKITLLENRKNILLRKSLLAKARQDFEIKKLFLSLFLRNSKGNPQDINIEQLPEVQFSLKEIKSNRFDEDLRHALSSRPELALIKVKKAMQRQDLKYSENLYKPKLDVEFGASKDRGNRDFDKVDSENFVNLDFSIPLQQRKAKGATKSSRSKLNALKLEERLIEDKIKIELSQIQTQIKNIIEIYYNLKEEAKLAVILEKAERERFWHGSSNFFLVNMREQDTARSKAELMKIFANYKTAKANYQFASFRK